MADLNTVTSIVAKHPKAAAKALKKLGHGEDTVLAHLEPWEARVLDRITDGQGVNKATGLLAFEDDAGNGNPGGGHNADGGASSGGYGGGDSGGSTSDGGSSNSGGSDQNGVSAPSGGFSFSADPSAPSRDYGADPSIGAGLGPTSAYGSNGEGLSIGDISGFAGPGNTPSMSDVGGMAGFASPVGSLTSALSQPEDMGHPAPAKPYDPYASPVKAAPERPGVRKDVDTFNNTVGRVTNLRQEVGVNPTTKTLDRHNFMDLSPVSIGLGYLTGLPIGHLMDLADIKDPYSFSADLGYGSGGPAGPGTGDGNQDIGTGPVNPTGTSLSHGDTLKPVTPSTPGSSYIPPTSPLASITPVGQTKLRARRGLMGDYAPNFRTSAV